MSAGESRSTVTRPALYGGYAEFYKAGWLSEHQQTEQNGF